MASLQDIRHRIASVKNTQKITRAMKMVAAAKLRRAQEGVRRTRTYAAQMKSLTNEMLARSSMDNHPLMTLRSEGRVGLVVVTSDRGLCGGFNAHLSLAAIHAVREDFAERDVELIVLGRKGVEFLRRRGFEVRRAYVGIFEGLSPTSATHVVEELVREFIDGEFAEVHCLFSDFTSSLSQKTTIERLLPYGFESTQESQMPPDTLFEPSLNEILLALLAENVHVQFNRILHESAASEHAARMRAMDSATTNAGDVIARLTLRYNRARQDAITSEVVEVIGAAEAL